MAIGGIYGYGNSSYLNLIGLSSTANLQALSAINAVKQRGSSSSSTSSASASVESFLKTYQSELTSLESAAEKLLVSNSKGVFNKYEAASSDENVAVVTDSYRLSAGTEISLNVEALATAQKNVSQSHNALDKAEAGADMSFQIQSAAGRAAVNVSSTNADGTAKTYHQMYQEAANAINLQSSAGVRASVSNEDGKISLVLTSKETGEGAAFTVTGETGAAEGLETSAVQAQNASYTITENGETRRGTSSDNTVSLNLARITVELTGTGETEVYTGIDADKVISAVEDLVDSYNSVTSLLEENESRGNGTISHLASFNRGMGGEKTLEAVGITYNKDGELTLDAEKLREALVEDYEGTRSLLGGQFGIAERASTKADQALSDSIQRIVSNDLNSIVSNSSSGGMDFLYASRLTSSSPYFLSNMYAVGLFVNTLG